MTVKSLLAASMLVPALLSAITIAERGKPAEYKIVIPTDSSASQTYAAEELQKFTEQMTGVKLPIINDDRPLPGKAILLGFTRYTEETVGLTDIKALGEDGFTLKTADKHLCITGSKKRGTLYGVYELLENHGGCRWYSSWHTVIPRVNKWEIPELDDTQLPAFLLREPFWFDMFNGDLAARNKVNGNRMQLTDKHGGHSHRFGGGLGSCHTFEKLCPADKYFDTHPEYFSEINGRRVNGRTQLCLTNPDVLKIVTSNVLDRIRKDPGASFYGVSQNDWHNYCTCPECKALDDAEGSHAGTMIAFVNKVAEAVEEEFPHVIIETLAYQYTRKPPKTIKPRHNVMPCLCTIECDFSYPLARGTYKENRDFVDDIRGWSAISPRLYVWDYTTDFHSYIMPFPNILALQENVKFFQTNSVSYVFEQGAYQGRHGDFAELKAWLLAKWLWNPDLPQEKLLQDFFKGYYGAAAPYVRTYFDALHSFYRNEADKPLRIFDNIAQIHIPDEFFDRAAILWQRAEEAVQDQPDYIYNVRMGAIPVLYAYLSRMTRRGIIKVWVTEDVSSYLTPETSVSLATELLNRFKEAKDIRLSESMERHNIMLTQWNKIAQHPLTRPNPHTHAVVEDTLLHLGKRGTWGDTVTDPLAEDGSAMKLYNTHYEWCTTLPFREVAFDAGEKYRIRMRVRVEKKPNQTGQAFWSGVYDSKNKRSYGGCTKNNPDIGEKYTWYTVAEWIPEKDHYFWIGPGRFDKEKGESAIKAMYIDRLEIERTEIEF